MAAEVREGLRRRPALPGDQRALQSEASAFRFPKSRPGLLRQRSAGLPVGFRRSSGSGDSTGFQWRILGRGAAVPGDRFRPDASPAPGRGGRLAGKRPLRCLRPLWGRGSPGSTLFRGCRAPPCAQFCHLRDSGRFPGGQSPSHGEGRGSGIPGPGLHRGTDVRSWSRERLCLGRKESKTTTALVLCVSLGAGTRGGSSARAATGRAVPGRVSLSERPGPGRAPTQQTAVSMGACNTGSQISPQHPYST